MSFLVGHDIHKDTPFDVEDMKTAIDKFVKENIGTFEKTEYLQFNSMSAGAAMLDLKSKYTEGETIDHIFDIPLDKLSKVVLVVPAPQWIQDMQSDTKISNFLHALAQTGKIQIVLSSVDQQPGYLAALERVRKARGTLDTVRSSEGLKDMITAEEHNPLVVQAGLLEAPEYEYNKDKDKWRAHGGLQDVVANALKVL